MFNRVSGTRTRRAEPAALVASALSLTLGIGIGIGSPASAQPANDSIGTSGTELPTIETKLPTNKYVQLEIENSTARALDVSIPTPAEGGTTGRADNATPALPTNAIALDPEETSPAYGIDMSGIKRYTLTSAPLPMLLEIDFDNWLNIQLEDNTGYTELATMTHLVNAQGTSHDVIEENARTTPLKLNPPQSDTQLLRLYDIELIDTGQPNTGFQHRYRLVITDRSEASVSRAPVLAGKQLTGIGNPVYRFDTTPYEISYTDGIPAHLPIEPFEIHGQTDDTSNWEKIGDWLTTGAPTVDSAAGTVSFPPASFYWENTTTEYSRIKVMHPSMPTPAEFLLANLPGPPADLRQPLLTITMDPTTSPTAAPVTANGVAQEPLKLKLKVSNLVINPDDDPSAARLYDHVYFRTSAGTLLTGLYTSRADGGAWHMSTTPGQYTNIAPLGVAANSPVGRYYLSSTATEGTRITAHVAVQAVASSTELLASPQPPLAAATGYAQQQIAVSGGLADPVRGVYHHFNGERASGVLLTTYAARSTRVPDRSPYVGEFVVRSGGTYAEVRDSGALEHVNAITVDFVNAQGTHVAAPSLPVRP